MKLKNLFLSVLLLMTLPAFSAIKLELTQGVNSAIPIAIVPCTNQTNNVPNNTTMTAVIQTDLQNSGEFRVMNSSASTDPNYWK